MECPCNGVGLISENMEQSSSQEESRDCQFNLNQNKPKQNITINQLANWEHYNQPIPGEILTVIF